LFVISFGHTQTHITAGRTPLDHGSARRRDPYITTRTLYKTNNHAPRGIRAQDPSKRTASDLRVPQRGHLNRHCMYQLRLRSEAVPCIVQLELGGTHAETRFRFSAKWTSPCDSEGVTFQSTTGSQDVLVSWSHLYCAGQPMLCVIAKHAGYPPNSPVAPLIPLPRVAVCIVILIMLYQQNVFVCYKS
jgi:hypothetical protein